MTEQQEGAPTSPIPTEPPRKRFSSGFATLRDVLAFVAGLGIIANEVFIADQAETAIVAVGVAMLGLPAVFGADEKRKGGGGDG